MPLETVRERASNFELYRIICMFLIISHHFLVHSGLMDYINIAPSTLNSFFALVFGMWGKTGINCFLMITGYFMCEKQIKLNKLLKLIFEIITYNVIIYTLFLISGQETLSITRILKVVFPVWGLSTNFSSCFIVFYLTIPFLNILVQSINQRQHECLLLICLFFYTLLGSIPSFLIAMNYVTWFCIIFLIASYIRLYPKQIYEVKSIWLISTIVLILIAIISCIVLQNFSLGHPFFFVSDSNKILAVAIATSSFLFFKNLNIKYSNLINIIGGTTFGVFLIHDNSNSMRELLWVDIMNCSELYNLPLLLFSMCSILYVATIFAFASIIDIIRQKLIESPTFKLLDKTIAAKSALLTKITGGGY